MNNIISYAVISIGAVFNLAGCVGLIRMPDVYNRLQAATKSVTLGTGMILFGVFLHAGFSPLGVKALLAIGFIFLASPTGAHALARGAYKDGIKLWPGSVCDSYGPAAIVSAKDVMNREIITITPDATVEEAMNILIDMKISGLPVVDPDGNMVGIVSEKDIINFSEDRNIKKAKVRDIMTSKVVSFPPETEITKIVKAISENRFRRVPIVEDGKPVGIVSRRDILHLLTSENKEK